MAELPDDAELGAACDALKDRGLDAMADLFARLVGEARAWRDKLERRAGRLRRVVGRPRPGAGGPAADGPAGGGAAAGDRDAVGGRLGPPAGALPPRPGPGPGAEGA